MQLRYLPYQQIDKEQWDRCINRSTNRLIYAKSFYLDAMADNWDALVLDEYQAVMPLTWRKKWGVKYLYQPAFTQQLGIFFSASDASQIATTFLDEAARHFSFIEINLNYLNQPTGAEPGFTKRNNFVLQLGKNYEDVRLSYPGITIKNLKRAHNSSLKYEFTTDYLSVLKLYKKLYAARMPHVTQEDYFNFSAVCKKLAEENNLVVRKVTDESGEMLAAGVFPLDRNRLYNMVSCITEAGKKMQAKYFLYDELIKEFSNSKFLLDFEGSDIPGIADFYNHFLPDNHPYPFFKQNNLPKILRLFKK